MDVTEQRLDVRSRRGGEVVDDEGGGRTRTLCSRVKLAQTTSCISTVSSVYKRLTWPKQQEVEMRARVSFRCYLYMCTGGPRVYVLQKETWDMEGSGT